MKTSIPIDYHLGHAYSRRHVLGTRRLHINRRCILPRDGQFLIEILYNNKSVINGKPTNFFKLFAYFGHIINDNLNDGDYIINKRIKFMTEVNNLLCFLHVWFYSQMRVVLLVL